MSETEGTKSVPDNDQEEGSSVDADVPKTESDDNADKEELKTPDESKPTEPEEKSSVNKKEIEEKKESIESETPPSKPTTTATATATATATTTTTSDQRKPGECNLLPVLVERLRSALELSCSSQSSEDQLPLEDSGIDSEEDLRMWASGLCNTIEQNNQSPKPLDLKFLEDLLLSDIQTALSRLQDTLKRVDVNTLTKYNSTLDSTNKLHLLRLISNLLSKLNIPEELTHAAAATAADSGTSAACASGDGDGDGSNNKTENTNKLLEKVNKKRRRANRHTIGVSAEEIAHARKLLDEEKNLSNVLISTDIKLIEIKKKPISSSSVNENVEPNIFSNADKPSTESIFNNKPAGITVGAGNQLVNNQAPTNIVSSTTTDQLKTFEQVRDKDVKDAINQQQTYYNKNKEFYKENIYYNHPPAAPPLQSADDNNSENLNRMQEIQYKDEIFNTQNEDESSINSSAFYQQSIPSKYSNKFGAKKSKIKRANTIDIPNYLKLQADNFGQNQSISLRRPIDIGDKNSSGNNTNIIPAFKPKTDNDRKFLALINKNNDATPSNSNLPFKSFNYRQPANIDKNWNSRFSNIKTTFDKPQSTNFLTNEDAKSQIESSRRSQSGANSDSGESDGVVVGSLRLPYTTSATTKQKQSGFTHAPTSPFQKIEKPSNRNENASIFKSGYLPKGGNSLQAKVKIFNQENNISVPLTTNSIVAQTKNKFNKINDNSQYGGDNKPAVKSNQHAGNFNYNPNLKQNTDSNKNDSKQLDNTLRSYLPGNRNVISSKLIVNSNLNDDVTPPKVKSHQYPSYLGYQTNTSSKNKTDKISSNDEQNDYSQFQKANSSYNPEKLYSGYSSSGISQPKNVDVPARTSSHSFMLQKIANDNNNYESKPKVNRYVNEALKIKDNNKEVKSVINQPLTSHYIKPAAPTTDNYSGINNVPMKNHSIQNKNTLTTQNYSTNNDFNKISSQEYSHLPKTKINTEYKPLQAYPTHDDNIRLSNIPNQDNIILQDTNVPFVNTSNNMTQSFPPSYETAGTAAAVRYSTQRQNDPVQSHNIPVIQRNPLQDVNVPSNDPNYATHSFARSSDATNERYSVYSINDGVNQSRNNFNQDNFVEETKLPATQINSITGKIQGEHHSNLVKNQSLVNKQDSNYIPYENYQTKKDSGSSDAEHLKNYQDLNHYNPNTNVLGNERLQSYKDNSYDEYPFSQNQTVQYNPSDSIQGSLREDNNSDKEIQMNAESVQPEVIACSNFDLYKQKDMLLEDENIQNQDISSDGIVTRYQCAIATVATTPESSEADVTEVSFPNPKLYNLKIAAYAATAPNEQSQIPQNVNYGGYNQIKTLSVRNEPQKEVRDDESADAFDEIQRHNLLQQQIIQKLQNDGNSINKDVRRRSIEKFKWDGEKSSNEIPDRRSSYYEKFKSDDKSPTSPLPVFPFNKTNTPPKQSEEPVIECNNTLEKISIFEEKNLQPLPPVTRQRFRPLSIPKFDNKARDTKPPKINVVTPSKIVKAKISENNDTGVISSSTNICDSSDEYLMSCASRQSRSIVLSKSESWHQLALSRGNLQPPQPSVSINHLLKPPKPKSPASLKLSKQYEASSSTDNMKRMEEKIQRYFHSPTNIPGSESHNINNNSNSSFSSSSSSSTRDSKRESKSKRNFSSKKNQNTTTGLSRSHTMPHLYDEKLIIDENTDVEKAFDSLFMEATRTDNRY